MQFQQCDCLRLNQFYKQHKDKARAKPTDLMYIATEDEVILSGLRLLSYGQYYFLRSVLTAPAVRGQKTATKLLAHVIATSSLPIYTLPTENALPLYQRLGFIAVKQDDIPAELLSSYRRFRQSSNGPTVMVINN